MVKYLDEHFRDRFLGCNGTPVNDYVHYNATMLADMTAGNKIWKQARLYKTPTRCENGTPDQQSEYEMYVNIRRVNAEVA